MKVNNRLRKDYDRLFRQNPAAANLFLLLTELADDKGRIKTDEKELQALMAARFNRPDEYAFGGELKK
jgi:hypothetical protein